MTRAQKLKNPEDYQALVAEELAYYLPMGSEVGVGEETLKQAADLGVRDGIYRHRESKDCKFREEECVTWNIRHFADLTLVKACLLASDDDEMERAEAVLLKLIED